MAKTLRNMQIKRDRLGIVGALRMIYARLMPGEELYLIILDRNPEYTRTLLVRDANYLHEKGYLHFEGDGGIDVKSISVKHCLFKLTASGMDVADRLVVDPTLEV